MRAFAYGASTYNASICEHMRMRAFASHRMRTHFSCVMRTFAYVIWASSVSVIRAYARIRIRCERIRIACARIRIACARIACECAHLRGTYACPVLYSFVYSLVSHYHHCEDLSESIGHKYLWSIFCRAILFLYNLWACQFSLPISLLMTVIPIVFHLITIINSGIWIFSHGGG